MIRCTPQGVCSWNFRLEGEGHRATLEFNWLNEQGAITVDGVRLEVRKHGVFSGYWTLDHETKEVVSGQKPNAFTRTFEIRDPGGALTLRAESAFSRSFRVERAGNVMARMVPDHAFTRRATIEIHAREWDFATVCFAFWLVVLTWRRAAQSNSSGG